MSGSLKFRVRREVLNNVRALSRSAELPQSVVARALLRAGLERVERDGLGAVLASTTNKDTTP